MTATTAQTPTGPARRRAWPTLVAGGAIAVLSALAGLAHGPAWLQAVLIVAAIVLTGYAAWLAAARPSHVVAPLAICLVALGNPMSLAGLTTNVETHAGLITLRTGGVGLVLWKLYPGIAGWRAPDDPEPTDTVALLRSVQSALDTATDGMSSAYRLTWRVADRPTGVTPIANGFGGSSMFQRVDAPEWLTRLDGSAAQRAAMIAAARTAAHTLSLGEERTVAGSPQTGDGELAWSDATGTLALRLQGADVSLSYVGGPFLAPTALPGEFRQRMAGFVGQTPPAPLVAPDLP